MKTFMCEHGDDISCVWCVSGRPLGDNGLNPDDPWKTAIENATESVPMQAEIWAAGADMETAGFVAKQLRKSGYYLVRAQDIDWPQIHAFNNELRTGQGIFEDAGGFFQRCIMALFGKKTDTEVLSYRRATAALIDEIDEGPSDWAEEMSGHDARICTECAPPTKPATIDENTQIEQTIKSRMDQQAVTDAWDYLLGEISAHGMHPHLHDGILDTLDDYIRGAK